MYSPTRSGSTAESSATVEDSDASESRTEHCPVGKGKVLFTPLPLELNDNLQVIGEVYRYALKDANVAPFYSTTVQDPGIAIAPTRFPHATLYVITSESSRSVDIIFRDQLSQKQLSGRLDPGRVALLLVEQKGNLAAAYHWNH